MAKKLKKFSRSISPRRGGEKYRRAGRQFDRAVIAYIILVIVSVVVGMKGEYTLSSASCNGFAINFLILPAYLPLLLADGIVCCFSNSILKAGQEVFIFGVCDLLLAFIAWGWVRLAAAGNQRISVLRTAKIFALIMVSWGIFQLGCCAVQFARSKSALSVRSVSVPDQK